MHTVHNYIIKRHLPVHYQYCGVVQAAWASLGICHIFYNFIFGLEVLGPHDRDDANANVRRMYARQRRGLPRPFSLSPFQRFPFQFETTRARVHFACCLESFVDSGSAQRSFLFFIALREREFIEVATDQLYASGPNAPNFTIGSKHSE